MVRTVLGVVFQNEECGVVPVRAVGNRIDGAADREIVVGDISRGSGHTFPESSSMVIRQAQQNKVRHFVFAGFSGLHKFVELV